MKTLTSIIIVISLWVYPIVSVHKERNLLHNQFKDKTKSLDHLNEWRIKLKDEFKTTLKNLTDDVKKGIIADADNVLKTSWEPLLAMSFLEFKINGNRNHFEAKNFHRRERLEALVLAELLTEKDQYLNEIANGIWLILEESTWTWPAHLGAQKAGVGLPDPNQWYIDLGAGETSAQVAWVKFLVGDKLSKLSPMISKRIDYELNRRIIETYLKESFGWEGLSGQSVNNWNVWINTNVLMTTLLTVEQNKTLDVINKIIKSVDDWINWYGDDGGCDEGPSYWYQAAGRFIQFLFYMTSASNHQIDFSKDQLFNSIGSYIYKMHIDGNYFVNFADASPKQIPDPALVYLYGQVFNNTDMKEFAAYLYHLDTKYLLKKDSAGTLHLYNIQMSSLQSLMKTTPKAPQPLESWFPDLQVVTLRSQKGSAKGLFLGAKAGTNGESHNHNDVGNFVLYVDGLPAVIDVGVGEYTAKTFGAHRYDIWSMQSQWHNTPTINGVQQHDGLSFSAHNVSYQSVGDRHEFKADISGAYPKEAHVKSWVRSLSFDRTKNTIDLSETYSLDKYVVPSKIHFVTILSPTYVKDSGEVVLKNEKTKLVMKFDSNLLDVVIDEHKTEDQHLSSLWGEKVNRVSLVLKQKDLSGKHSILFQS